MERMGNREQKDWADICRVMAMIAVRNTKLEDIHAGLVPVSRTGDFSDVTVVDADGRRIPWPEVSHIDDSQMRDLMRQVVNRLYTFFMMDDDPDFQDIVMLWLGVARRWDEPRLDEELMRGIEVRRGRNEEHNR